jgi:hypothetical protein
MLFAHVMQIAALPKRGLGVRQLAVLLGLGALLFGEGHCGRVLRGSLSVGLVRANELAAPLDRGSKSSRRSGAGVRLIMGASGAGAAGRNPPERQVGLSTRASIRPD